MIKAIAVNGVALALLAGCYLGYAIFVGRHIPGDFALVLNLMIMPTLFGVVGYFVFIGPIGVKLLLLAPLPIVTNTYFGGDPAKPGLENVVAVFEFGFLILGCGLAALIRKYLGHA